MIPDSSFLDPHDTELEVNTVPYFSQSVRSPRISKRPWRQEQLTTIHSSRQRISNGLEHECLTMPNSTPGLLSLSEFDDDKSSPSTEERLLQALHDETITRLELVDISSGHIIWTHIANLLKKRPFESVHVTRCVGGGGLDDWGDKTKRLTLHQQPIRPTFLLGAGLRELSLISTSLSEPVLMSLGAQMEFHPTLEVLDLTGSRFLGTGVSILASNLASSTLSSLRTLCVSECNLMDEQVAELVVSLHHHSNLEELDISFNKCRSFGMEALAQLILTPSSNLTKLSMGFQAFGEAKRIDLSQFCNTLGYNHTLTDLELGGNSLRDDDFPNLWNALCQNDTLVKLDLSENRFTNQSMAMLVDRLDGLSQLRHLVLEENRFIDEAGLGMLADALLASSSSSSSSSSNLVVVALEEVEVNLELMQTNAWRQLSYFMDIHWGTGARRFQENPCFLLSLWPLVLARANEPRKHGLLSRVPVAADIIYHLLRGQPTTAFLQPC